MQAGLHLRPAEPRDVAVMLRFIRELAEYEREPEAVVATEADLLRDGFALAADGITRLREASVRFRAFIAEWREAPGEKSQAAGFALYFTSYSTWLGRHGIRLEDLYVTPALRGRGIGRALLQRLAVVAVSEGCERLEWDVLAWNQPAIDVYHRVGAWVQTEWRIMRVAGDALRALAAADGSAAGRPGSESPEPGHPVAGSPDPAHPVSGSPDPAHPVSEGSA